MTDGTIFTPELLDTCISCGFCLPACPTYQETGQETSSPRGRINLMRALETGVLPDDDPLLTEEASLCLGCRACEPVCPAGVHYGELLEEWRDHGWRGRRRPLKVRPLLWIVNAEWRVRLLGFGRRHARARATEPGASLFLGCFERLLFPRVSRSAQSLSGSLDVPSKQGCCGALHAHNGELARGRKLAQAVGETLPGLIVTTSGGCAAHLSAVLGRDRITELSEWLAAGSGPRARVGGSAQRPRICLQDSCHLRNGLGVYRQARELLRAVGDYVELPSAAACCGAAGTYALLRPAESRRVLAQKLTEIADANVDIVATLNPGCYRQLKVGIKRSGLDVEVLHIAEILERAGFMLRPES